MNKFIDYATGKLLLFKQMGAMLISGGLQFGDSVTLNISSNSNNFVISDIDKVSILNLNVSATSNLTGITNPAPLKNRLLFLYNVGTANLTIINNSGLSLVENRFLLKLDILIQPGEGVILNYDNDPLIQRWKIPAKNV